MALLLWGIAGCSQSSTEVPFMTTARAQPGVKMLRPRASASRCRLRFFWTRAGSSPADEALAALLALDSEADALANLRMDTSSFWLGVAERTCVTVIADVVRSVPLVLLPGGPDHAGHH